MAPEESPVPAPEQPKEDAAANATQVPVEAPAAPPAPVRTPEEEALHQARQALPREVVDALDAVHRLERRYHTITPEQAASAVKLLLGEEHQDKAPIFLKAK